MEGAKLPKNFEILLKSVLRTQDNFGIPLDFSQSGTKSSVMHGSPIVIYVILVNIMIVIRKLSQCVISSDISH